MKDRGSDSAQSVEPRDSINKVFEHLPCGTDEQYRLLLSIQQEFNGAMAEIVTQLIAKKIETTECNLLEHKKALADSINSIALSLGLAIAAGDTREPTLLIARRSVGMENLRSQYASHYELVAPSTGVASQRIKAQLGCDLRDEAITVMPVKSEILEQMKFLQNKQSACVR